MNTPTPDLNDNEIRVISSEPAKMPDLPPDPDKKWKKRLFIFFLVCIPVIVVLIIFLRLRDRGIEEQSVYAEPEFTQPTELLADTIGSDPAYVEVRDTIVNNVPLTILTPKSAIPRLCIGVDALLDSTATMVVQAADVRSDNGKIVGTYVFDGQLISRGQSKTGFCAIIRDKVVIGVADSTPLVEQALESEGYFFRQYPLVVGGQVVENKPKGKALRKALAELNGQIVVILSRSRLSFHDFASTLSDMGVSNAIYLVGSSAYGFARDADGRMIEFGKPEPNAMENTNYIVWK